MEIVRLEQPQDWREVENLTRESFWNVYPQFCQSCGMPLTKDEDCGHNADDAKILPDAKTLEEIKLVISKR